MSCQNEKKNFLDKIAKLSKTNCFSTRITKQLHSLLLKDTNNGKLYKYRRCNKYAFNNLRDGTIYCQHPLKFNDPFDCRFGITIQSFYEAKIDVEIDTMVLLFQNLRLSFNNRKHYKNLSTQERKVIGQLLKDSTVLSFLRKSSAHIHPQDSFKLIFRRNPSVAIHIMKVILQNPQYEKSMNMLLKLLPDIEKTFLGTNNDDARNSSEYDIKDIALQNGIDLDADEIGFFKELFKKTDPSNLYSITELEKMMEKYVSQLNNKNAESFIIGCLAGSPKNRLMWSHYAADHKGFCIEYNFEDIKTLDAVAPLPIIYTKERPKFPFKPAICKTKENIDGAIQKTIVGLLTKDEAWSYENEWRIMIKTRDNPNLKMPPISCVYLGAQISTRSKNKIIKIAKDKGIPVKQMILDRGTYELHAVDVKV